MTIKILKKKIADYKRILLRSYKKEPVYFFLILLIIILSLFFRTYNYSDRVFIQADNSRDVQVARYAADNFKLPQIGQFSSAGPFFYGPWYYWFLEFISFIPLGFLTHWYIISALYLVFIWLIFWLGKEVDGKWVGTLAALFAAISPAQINYSFSTWNPAITPLLVLVTLIFLVRFFKSKKLLDIFLLGFTVSLAITIHFQNILILPTLLVAIFSFKPLIKNYLRYLPTLALGFLIPLLPLIYFDLRHNWYNSISLFIYLAIDQYRIWVPNRWLTYLGVYWPDAWGFIIGGNRWLGGAIISLLSIFTLLRLRHFTKNRLFLLIAVTFVLEVVMYRYYRGERYQYYSLFAHPVVLLLTAWVSIQIFRIQKMIGIVWIILIFFTTLNLASKDLKKRGVTYPEIKSLKNQIYSEYPSSKFDIYGCESNASSISHPLALIMYYESRNETTGVKIGVCETENSLSWIPLTDKDFTIKKYAWINKSTSTVYQNTVEWWKEKPPKGGGDFWEFIKKNLNPKCWPHC